MLPVESLAGLLVNTCIFSQISLVEGTTYPVDEVGSTDTLLGDALIEGEDLVGVVAEVDVPSPVQVLGPDDRTIEGKFETVVPDGTYVHRNDTGRVTSGIRDILGIEKVLGLPREYLEGTVEIVVEEFEVNTCVEGLGSLPGQVLVTLVSKVEGVLVSLFVV